MSENLAWLGGEACSRDFPASRYQSLVGRTIVFVADHPEADEGFRITLDDGSVLDITFSGCEGSITHDA
jgi:hypothetical protein